MKKLNRKGFTLVELLAVIVILAIVVGITMVTILPTLENSRKKAFDTAVETISNYIQDQKDMSLLSADLRGSTYNSGVGEADCDGKEATAENPNHKQYCDGTTGNLLTTTGYDKNITEIKWYVENGVAKIQCATANDKGDYRQGTYPSCKTNQQEG